MPPLPTLLLPGSLVNPVDTTVTEDETFSFTAGFNIDNSSQIGTISLPAFNLNNFVNNLIEVRITYKWLFQRLNTEIWLDAKRTLYKDSYDFKLAGQNIEYILTDTLERVARITSTARKIKCQISMEHRLGNTPYKILPKTPFVGPLVAGQSPPEPSILETTYATLTVNAKPSVYVQDLFNFSTFETILEEVDPLLLSLLKEAATRISKSIELKPLIKRLLNEASRSYLIELVGYEAVVSSPTSIAECRIENVLGVKIDGIKGIFTTKFKLFINNSLFYLPEYTNENRITILLHELGHALGVTVKTLNGIILHYQTEYPDCTVNDPGLDLSGFCSYVVFIRNAIKFIPCSNGNYYFLDGNIFKRAQSVYRNLTNSTNLRYIPLSENQGHWDNISRNSCSDCDSSPCLNNNYKGIGDLMNPFFDPSSLNTYLSELSVSSIEDYNCMQRPVNAIYSISLPFDRNSFVSDEAYNQIVSSQIALNCVTEQ